MIYTEYTFGSPISTLPIKMLNHDGELVWHQQNSEPGLDLTSYLIGLLGCKNQEQLDSIVIKAYRGADQAASMSVCQRAKIGCALSSVEYIRDYEEDSDNWVYGYNSYPLEDIQSCSEIGCKPEVTCRLTIHAEAMAIREMIHRYWHKGPKILFCNAAPCLDCMKLCIQNDIKYIFFREGRPQPEYDRPAMSWLAKNSGIKFIRVIENA